LISLEHTILGNLLQDEAYARKVLPYLKPNYFNDVAAPEIRVCFELISNYFLQYDRVPTAEAMGIDLSNRTDLPETTFRKAADYLESLFGYKRGDTSEEWLVETTERFCKQQAIQEGIRATVAISSGHVDKNDKALKGLTIESIPGLWNDALSVSFDTHIGHDFFADADVRLEAYHNKEHRLPFDLILMNEATNGGLPPKSLTCIMAPTGKGKTTVMVSWAASHLSMGKNVLYITLEMGETVPGIGERIDANLLDTHIGSMVAMPREIYRQRIETLRGKTTGRLIIKEYPTASANVGHFRRLLLDLKVKQKFVPDIVYVDYINLCTSIRIRTGSDFNSYTYVKYIAEELRGLAVEFGIPIVTATQVNRGGYGGSDMDIENVSESIGLPATLDFMLGLITDESLDAMNQIILKQLKNRWKAESLHKKMRFGIERSKMKLYNLEPSAQDDVVATATAKAQYRPGMLDFSGIE